MELSPERIFKECQGKRMNKHAALELLISLIESSEDETVRVKALKVIQKLRLDNPRVYELLENLLISDANASIRTVACEVIRSLFLNQSLMVMKWDIAHEKTYWWLMSILQALVDMNSEESKELLIAKIKSVMARKYLLEDKKIMNKSFTRDFRRLFHSREPNSFTHEELSELIVNYETILALKNKFYSVYYELEAGKVVKLDLSDIEYEVRGWRADLKNDIHDLSDITGLENLKELKSLNLGNNHVKNLEKLTSLKNLTHLFINNNNVKEQKNLQYLTQLKDLKFLDISQNPIVNGRFISELKQANQDLKLRVRKIFY